MLFLQGQYLHFVTNHSLFGLASMPNHAKNEAPEGEARVKAIGTLRYNNAPVTRTSLKK